MTLTYQDTEILYPYAMNHDGKLVHINNSNGEFYYCPNCREEMIPRRGDIKAWHYAHKISSPICNFETALHVYGKVIIKQKFDDGKLPIIYYRCPYCKKLLTYRNLSECDSMAMDDRFIQKEICGQLCKIKPDGIFYSGDEIKAALEIIVTNPISAYKFGLYHNSQIPVIVWRPSWEQIYNDVSSIFLMQTINIASQRCPSCASERNIRRGNDYI